VLVVITRISQPAVFGGMLCTVTLNVRVEPTANEPWLAG